METLEQLRDWLHHFGAVATDKDILTWTGRSARTLCRWKREGVPVWARDCIVRNTGLVRVKTKRSFEVWRVLSSGDVTCPAGDTYKLSELRAMTYYKQAMNSYRVRAIAAEKENLLIKVEYSQSGRPAANDREFLPNRSR